MKALLRSRLKKKLAEYACQRLASASPKPKIVAVTGSVGKTTTKEAIAAAIGDAKRVLVSEGNYNTAFGVPLTILGLKGGESSYGAWKDVLAKAKTIAAEPWTDAPDVIVLEYAVDHPGDMDELLAVAKPDVAVLTAIPDMPVHAEFFPSAEALAEEKGKILDGATSAFVYGAEKLSASMAKKHGAKTYGFGDGYDVRVQEPSVHVNGNGPEGLSGKLSLDGASLPLKTKRAIANVQFLSAAVGVAVAKEVGVNSVEALGRVAAWQPPKRRMERKTSADGVTVIDDTYNASPGAMIEALEVLREYPAMGRRMAIVGDMRELHADDVQKAHEAVGKKAAESADVVIAVGDRASVVAEAVRKAGGKDVREAATSESVAGELAELEPKDGDVLLFKASRALELDGIVDALAGQE